MKLSFKRITSSGSFIPEIDGLRFIAIASVVLFHLSGFLTAKYVNQNVDTITQPPPRLSKYVYGNDNFAKN